jgi:hypothetical protein
VADTQDSAFAVISAGIIGLQRQTSENLCGSLEIEASLNQGALALGVVIGNPHGITVYTLNELGKSSAMKQIRAGDCCPTTRISRGRREPARELRTPR